MRTFTILLCCAQLAMLGCADVESTDDSSEATESLPEDGDEVSLPQEPVESVLWDCNDGVCCRTCALGTVVCCIWNGSSWDCTQCPRFT